MRSGGSSQILGKIVRFVSPATEAAQNWVFWTVILGIMAIAIVFLLLFPLLKAVLFGIGRVIGIFMH